MASGSVRAARVTSRVERDEQQGIAGVVHDAVVADADQVRLDVGERTFDCVEVEVERFRRVKRV